MKRNNLISVFIIAIFAISLLFLFKFKKKTFNFSNELCVYQNSTCINICDDSENFSMERLKEEIFNKNINRFDSEKNNILLIRERMKCYWLSRIIKLDSFEEWSLKSVSFIENILI